MDVKELRRKIAELEKLQSTYSDMGKQIKQTMSLLNATLESTADGLLVVDNFGKALLQKHQERRMGQAVKPVLLSIPYSTR